MNFSAFVARRYLFSKKSHSVINIISIISILGVATGTLALVIVLSVFNGFDDLIKSVFSTFDPDVKIIATQGKVFNPNTPEFDKVKSLNYIDIECETLEENVLLEYNDKQHPAIIKGVESNFNKLTGITDMMYDGKFQLEENGRNYTAVGLNIAYFLSIGLNFVDPIFIYVPKRNSSISLNPRSAFNKKYIFPKGIFQVHKEIDSKYILTPIKFTRELLNYSNEISALEIKFKPETDIETAQNEIAEILGGNFTVKNKYQQHELLNRVMKSEKFATYLILTFILIVASFNIIGSISMLIIDKKDDITTLKNLGMRKDQLRKIFLFEGWMISIGGAMLGLLLGAIICWIQQTFGVLKLDAMGTFLVDAYPVKMQLNDFILIFITVITIGLFASWYPVRYFTKHYLKN